MQETTTHLEAFEFFYNNGVPRSYPQVARYFKVSTTSIKKWSKAFQWKKRVKDKELQSVTRAVKKKLIEQDALSPKEAYRKDIENTIKIIKATILSAVDKNTKKLNIVAETPKDINTLAMAYEKLAKLDILLSEDEDPKVENAIQLQPDLTVRRKNKLGAGRSSKLTPELQEKLLTAVRGDMKIGRACLLCRITPQTLFNWKKWGEIERDRIVQAVNDAQRIAIEGGTLNASDSLEIEEFVDNKINELKPNKYFNFLIEIGKADADAERNNIEALGRARDGSEYVSEVHLIKNSKGKVTGQKEIKKYQQPLWTPAAWLLERKYPDLYGKHVKYDGILDAHITGEGDDKSAAQQKDEMQAKKRVAELALTLIKMASQNDIQKAITI